MPLKIPPPTAHGLRVTSGLTSLPMQNDLDLGASGAIVLKDKNYVITGGKQGPIYLLDATLLGGYEPNANNTNAVEARPCTATETGRSLQAAAPQRG